MNESSHRVSELNGKRIIDRSNGNEIASVKNLILDASGQNVAAIMVNEGGLFGGESAALHWQLVEAVGDVIVVRGPATIIATKDDAELNELLQRDRRITGTAVISDVTGQSLGNVADVQIDNSGRVLGFEVGNRPIFGSDTSGFVPINTVRTVGKDAIVTTLSELQRGELREREAGADTRDVGPSTHEAGANTRDVGPSTHEAGANTRDFGPDTREYGRDTRDVDPGTRGFGPDTREYGRDTRDVGPGTQDVGPDTREYGRDTRDVDPDARDFDSDRYRQ